MLKKEISSGGRGRGRGRACLDSEEVVGAGCAMLAHRGRSLPQEAPPAIGQAVSPAAANSIAKRLALAMVAFTAIIVSKFPPVAIVSTVGIGPSPATALAVCDRICSTA